MDFETIKKLIDLMEKSDISEMEVEESEFRVKLTKHHPGSTIPVAPIVSVSTPQVQVPPPAAPPTGKPDLFSSKEDLETVTSPMVGTLFRSPSPETPPYVEEGDAVTKGQTICLIEAMKVMNEIESPYDGKIISILVENAQPVEYGEALLLIKPRS